MLIFGQTSNKWSPIAFGPPTFLVPKKFRLQEIWSPRKCLIMIFMQGPIFLGPKLLGEGPNEIRDHFSYSHFYPKKKLHNRADK